MKTIFQRTFTNFPRSNSASLARSHHIHQTAPLRVPRITYAASHPLVYCVICVFIYTGTSHGGSAI